MVQKRILIVDDEKLVRWALNQKCAEYGYQTLEAENGEEAIRALQSESVDLVLLDVIEKKFRFRYALVLICSIYDNLHE